MIHPLHFRLFLPLVFCLLFALSTFAIAQNTPTILAESELARVVPISFYYQGQSAPTQMRNAAAVRFAPERYVVAGLVDTSGYSAEIRGKYEGFLITDSAIRIGGVRLNTGAYGFGFSQNGKMNIFDIGGKLILTVRSKNDKDLKRPRPLMMMQAADGVRLYDGRNYVILSAR
jgi:hypothetical protein